MGALHTVTRRKTRPTNTLTDLSIFIEKTPYNVICFRDGQKVISQTKPMYAHMHTNANNLKPAKCTKLLHSCIEFDISPFTLALNPVEPV